MNGGPVDGTPHGEAARTDEPQMLITTDRDEQGVVFRVSGEVDMASAPALVAAVDAERPFSGPVRLDLSQVSFIDSSGLRAILQVHPAAQQNDSADLEIISCGPVVRRVVELAGLDGVLRISEPPSPRS